MKLAFFTFIQNYFCFPVLMSRVIAMVDGSVETGHGGLTDRLRNILSLYQYCKEKSLRFSIYYTTPCNLSDMLIPNKYDWRISNCEVTKSAFYSRRLELWTCIKTKGSITEQEEKQIHINHLNNCIEKNRRLQYQVVGNAYFAEGHYAELFDELFKPSLILEKELNNYKKLLVENYDAVVLRFQMLLGDFEEKGNWEILADVEQQRLIDKCKKKIIELHNSQYFSSDKILVTSDSRTFLDVIGKLDFVMTLPGNIAHIDSMKSNNEALRIHMRSFVDLYMLRDASSITLLRTEKMYNSGFPRFAAQIGNKSFHYIDF